MADLPDRSKAPAKDAKPKGPKPPKEKKQQAQKKQPAKKKVDGAELIGITYAKEENLADWYQDVLLKAEVMDFSDVSGCYILLPTSYEIWERVRDFLDTRFKKMGVRNCYFPLFISKKSLEAEQEHLEGFEAEVAWVTQGGKDKLEIPLAIRPTSETAMYGWYSKKIRSHRDLPLKLNQWNNVVRWEFKHAMPFLRSREFLWQEGHTAHLTQQESAVEVLEILDHYAACYEELLAVPVVKGTKTDKEKFDGADYTTTIEGFIPATGRGIQAATSHSLGQHFSKSMFKIAVEDPSAKEGEKKDPIHVWQNSWGFTTRSIGVMIMVHSDNKGLVLPPRVASTQVVIIPVGITAKTTDEQRAQLYAEVGAFEQLLAAVGVRVEVDRREGYSPGYKFNDWELRGVPLQIEFGPKDAEKHQVTTSRRDVEGKETVPITELKTRIPQLLETMQAEMLARAKAEFDAHRVQISTWDKVLPTLDAKNIILIPFCLGKACEEAIKENSKRQLAAGEVEDSRAPAMGAKSLCIPFDQPAGIEALACVRPDCGKKAEKWVLFGRSY